MELASTIQKTVAAYRGDGRLEHAFRRWRARHDELAGIEDSEGLTQLLRDAQGYLYPAKSDALRAVCLEARAGDEVASVFLLWALLPALICECNTFRPVGSLSRGDIEAELVVGVLQAVARVGPTNRRVAARLIHFARRRALAAIKAESAWTSKVQVVPSATDLDGRGSWSLDPDDVLSRALREGILSAVDAELLLAKDPAGIALREGLTENAVWLRLGRARRRISDWLEGNLPGSQ